VPPSTADAALTAAAGVGPYFAWDALAEGSGWRPFAELLDGDVAAERVDAARKTLQTTFGLADDAVPVRVVASVTFLGVAARLLSPPLAAVAVGGVLPLAGSHVLWWRPVRAGPWPIAYDGGEGLSCEGLDADAVAAAFVDSAVRGPVTALLDVFRLRFRLSPLVLWGNVASALAGAAGMVADLSPPHAEPAAAVCERTLAVPPLAGTGTLVRPDPASARRFLVRHNCCLYYRIPGGGKCSDCVLTPDPDRRRHWESVLRRS
jgi:FhuF 2Fe-2S C-terminal domain